MTTSADSTIAVRSSRAAGCSILATIHVCTPAASIRSRAGIKSSALRTYETATKSTFCESACSRQSRSCGPTAGSLTNVRGTLIPFRSVRIPPSSTLHRTISPSKSGADRTSSRIKPSESKTGSPFCRSLDKPSHSTGSVLTISPRIVVLCGGNPSANPQCKSTSSPRSNSTSPSNRPRRSFGPGKSASSPMCIPVFFSASRMF